MIEVKVGAPAAAEAGAVVRPVAADFSPVTPAMRRFDEAAGPAVAAQCARLGEIPLGSAVITAAGELPADFIVHVAVRSSLENPTVGVVRRGLLNALRRLEDWDIDVVALVPLGTGAGNLDAEEAARLVRVPLLFIVSEGDVHAVAYTTTSCWTATTCRVTTPRWLAALTEL